MAKGIIFSAPMVLANRAGRKQQTRRLVNVPTHWPGDLSCRGEGGGLWYFANMVHSDGDFTAKPRYQPGDVVYVKETWAVSAIRGNHVQVNYMADDALVVLDDVCHDDREKARRLERKGPRSPMLMPAWAARDWIKILSVRVERLQEISEADCIAEGIEAEPADMIETRANGSGLLPEDAGCWYSCGGDFMYRTAREAYAALIDSIHGPGTWELNPWVWVYEYERAEAPKGEQ